MSIEAIVNLILAFCIGTSIALIETPIFVFFKKIWSYPLQNKKWVEKTIE